MITPIQNVESLTKILRSIIIEQLALPSKQVLNALSIRGSALHQNIGADKNIFDSFTSDQTIVIFELKEHESSDNVVYVENDDNEDIGMYAAFEFNLVIYGDYSGTAAQTLKARLSTEELLSTMLSNGIYIEEITDPTSISEFINGTMWKRKDISIYFACRLDIPKITKYQDYLSLGKLNVIEK